MNTSKTLWICVGVALVLGVLGLILPRYSGTVSLGGTTRSNTTVDADFAVTGATTLTGQLIVAGVVNSSGTSIGAGSVIKKVGCGTGTWNPGALPTDRENTTSTEITVSGASAAQSQVYFVGFNSSTLTLNATAGPSSTAGVMMVYLSNSTSTSRDLPSMTVTACYLQL